MLKRKSKQLLSIVLSACMIVPTVTAGVFTGSAAEPETSPVAAEVKPASAVGDDPQPSKPRAIMTATATRSSPTICPIKEATATPKTPALSSRNFP